MESRFNASLDPVGITFWLEFVVARYLQYCNDDIGFCFVRGAGKTELETSGCHYIALFSL